jgi:hypothetical protein
MHCKQAVYMHSHHLSTSPCVLCLSVFCVYVLRYTAYVLHIYCIYCVILPIYCTYTAYILYIYCIYTVYVLQVRDAAIVALPAHAMLRADFGSDGAGCFPCTADGLLVANEIP